MRFSILLLLTIFFSSNSIFAQKKLGLIVAVGKYPEFGRWKNLSSANDLKYLKAALIKNGFEEKNIDTLQDEKATKAAILKGLDDLYKKATKGDIVIFHFSGHGQQIEDDNGDEADGYDEALIPYDAKANYDPVSYNGQNHLRDDELGEKLALIRNKIGAEGSLVVVLDACHSGTATRANEFSISRGDPIPFQKPGYKAKNVLTMADLSKQAEGYFASPKESSANMIVFSASSPNQVNYETKDADQIGVGSLSYAFAKAISSLGKESDYKLLFEKIKVLIQVEYPMQIPLIEGNTSQKVFSGNYISRDEIIPIQKWLNETTFIINQGVLNGIKRGSVIKVMSTDGNLQAEGTIKQVATFQSICEINKSLPKNDAYEVKIDAVNNGSFASTVFVRNSAEKPGGIVETQVSKLIRKHPFLSLNNNADFMIGIEKANTGIKLSLLEKGDSIHWVKNLAKGDTLAQADFDQMLDQVKKSMRIKYFRTMSDGGSLADNMDVEIIPRTSTEKKEGEIRMKPLSLYDIKLTNNSVNNLYYTIIDLMPDNEVKVLLPTDYEEPQDRFIRAGQSYSISDVEVDEHTPMGKEFFKVIFTKTPMDLRNIFNRQRTRSNSELLSFEQVVDDMFSDGNLNQATRSNIGNVKVDEVGILTRSFSIIK